MIIMVRIFERQAGGGADLRVSLLTTRCSKFGNAADNDYEVYADPMRVIVYIFMLCTRYEEKGSTAARTPCLFVGVRERRCV